MILADITTTADESAWHAWFHGGRFVYVRYIDGGRGECIRTEDESRRAAAAALLTGTPDPRTGQLLVR
jgi:hypothetical protein